MAAAQNANNANNTSSIEQQLEMKYKQYSAMSSNMAPQQTPSKISPQ